MALSPSSPSAGSAQGAKNWLAFRKPRPYARLRLFCFPYAGGGASIYRAWPGELPTEIDVCPVQLPGREARLTETAFTHMEPLIDALGEALLPHMDMPFAFFGHSMGAVIGFELAHWLQRRGESGPAQLLVSARRAPQCPADDDEDVYNLPEEEFKLKLRELKGTPEQVLEHPELMQLMLPLLRADFELNDTYQHDEERTLLACPVSAYGGLEDEEVERKHLEAWREISRGPFKLRMFPGDHFFLHDGRRHLTAAVAEDLMRVLMYL